MKIFSNSWVFQNSVTAASDGETYKSGYNDLITVYITGDSDSRSILFQGCDADDNWYSIPAKKIPERTTATSTTGTDEVWEINLANWVGVRCRVDAVSGGAVKIVGRIVEIGSGMVGNKEVVIDAGNNIVGKVGIDQTTDGTTNKVVAKISQTAGENLVQLSGSLIADEKDKVVVAATDILSDYTALTTMITTLMIETGTSGVLSLEVDGVLASLNSGVALTTGQWYAMQIPIIKDKVYNLQFSVGATMQINWIGGC